MKKHHDLPCFEFNRWTKEFTFQGTENQNGCWKWKMGFQPRIESEIEGNRYLFEVKGWLRRSFTFSRNGEDLARLTSTWNKKYTGEWLGAHPSALIVRHRMPWWERMVFEYSNGKSPVTLECRKTFKGFKGYHLSYDDREGEPFDRIIFQFMLTYWRMSSR